ncbi:MAG TPA: DEAD/DEAH box helicase [Ramlibacter sp.]|jgi:preprotein translocase subunit SecA|nr:DEAD/DEAH box helicase [Ramlibacter sp.]
MGSHAAAWPFPGLVWGPYPQRSLPGAAPVPRPQLGAWSLRKQAQALRQELEAPADLDAGLRTLKAVPERQRDPTWLGQALLAAARAMEQSRGLRPYWQQLMAARALLDQRLVEMDTGEGKTVAIALAAAVAALAGTPVHVVTANDYLAERDALHLQAFYARLGLRAASITQPMATEARRAAYAADVTYCTGKELAFDYLRDGLLHPGDLSPLERRLREARQPAAAPVLRGLCMAILDEADTVLVDEARLPLVLSQPADAVAEEAFLRRALATALECRPGEHYEMDERGAPRLTPAGEHKLRVWPADRHPLLAHPQHRASALELALHALHGLERDRDYVVREGKVLLVDETTGRAAPGRAWSRGLHQLVELKEQLAPTARNSTVTQITFQRFFVRYLRLAGISGTLRGAAGELQAVYGLRTVRVPPRTPRRVRHAGTRVLADAGALWQAVAQRTLEMVAAGRPVLVGTETVAHSEALAAVLRSRGLAPVVLNARQDREENEVIGRAGEAGRVTVATSMAGRGADIAVPPDVQARGGLHVVLCQLNASARIDRQFLGRAGRQGQPGSCEVMVARDFALLQRRLPGPWRAALPKMPPLVAAASLRVAQGAEALARAQQRVTLARQAEAEERDLNFSRWGLG